MIKNMIWLAAFCAFLCANANAQATWQIVKSADGKFSASMPCKPTIETIEADPAKETTKRVSYSCTVGTRYYEVSYADFDIVLDSRSMLDAYAEGLMAESTLISKKPLLLGRIPGREFLLTSCGEPGPIISKWHIYHSGKRIYAITSAGLDPVPGAADTARLLTSFAILR